MPHSDNDTMPGTPDATGAWHTISEACEILGISIRTIRRRIEHGKVDSRLEGGRRMILVTESDRDSATSSATATDDIVPDTVDDTPRDGTVAQSELIDQLKSEVEYLRKQQSETNERYDQEKERADLILLQLTRQIEQSQRLLEYNQEPWYRRMFRKGRKEEID